MKDMNVSMMKKKMTFYLDEQVDKSMILWIHNHYVKTGVKINKSMLIEMLLKTLIEEDILPNAELPS